jgi:hypothetical protein
MISAVILSTVATILGLQQYASEEDFEHRTTQEEQRTKGNIDGQLKVGPTHRVPARVLAANGESWTSLFFCALLGGKNKIKSLIYVSCVGKNHHWSSELKF